MAKKVVTIPIEHKVLAVIDNFQMDLAEVALSKNLTIRRIDGLTEEERNTFTGREYETNHFQRNLQTSTDTKQIFHHVEYDSPAGRFNRTIERSNYILQWYFKARVQQPIREHYDYMMTPTHEFRSVLSALRILKDKTIGLFPQEHFLIEFPLPKEFRRSSDQLLDGYQLSDPLEVEPYVFTSDEIDILIRLSSAIRNVKQPGLLTALARLDNQYTRAYVADRLIDAVIALEALYAGEMMNEIALRVGLRISTHLGGSDADQRERFFELISLAYNLRSRLVHGSMHNTNDIEREVKKKGWRNTETFIEALDNVLRQALRYILLGVKDRKLKDLLHEPLDKAIRRGEVFRWEMP